MAANELSSRSLDKRALHAFREGTAEFVDCLHTGLCSAADRSPLFTFDAIAARMQGVEMVAG